MGKPARKTAFPFTPKRGHFNTPTYSFNEKMPKIQRTFVTIFVFSTQLGFSFFDAKKLGKSQKPVNQISHSFKNCQLFSGKVKLFSAKVKKLHFFYFSKL